MAGNLNHLDTKSFESTINAYQKYIKEFEEIVSGVNKTAGTVIEHWSGKGRNAFEKDYKQVQLNLKDISDIMYDIRDALVDAQTEYTKTDASLSKSFES